MSLLRYLPLLMRKKTKQILSVSTAIARNQITFSPHFLERFEEQFAKFCGADFALSFCNGTSAIEAALFVCGVRPGDEVIVPSCTFHASIDPYVTWERHQSLPTSMPRTSHSAQKTSAIKSLKKLALSSSFTCLAYRPI